MQWQRVLKEQTIVTALRAGTKDAVLEELLDVLCRTGHVRDRARALDALREREQKMSTGMQHGVAIPHGRTDAVDTLVAALALTKRGVPFDSLDRQPARIIVMSLSPPDAASPHIQFLSQISRLLNDAGCRRRILEADDPGAVLHALNV